jgi:hypothetical protein
LQDAFCPCGREAASAPARKGNRPFEIREQSVKAVFAELYIDIRGAFVYNGKGQGYDD